jgi:hypothetical protein
MSNALSLMLGCGPMAMLERSGLVVTVMAVVVVSFVKHDNRQPPFSGLLYRSAKPRGCGGVIRQGPWRVYPFVLAQITCCGEKHGEALNRPKATEASARSSCRELLLVCSKAGSAGKQLPILPLLQNNNLCELSLLRDTVSYTLQVWILRATTGRTPNPTNSPSQATRSPCPPCLHPPTSSRSSPRPQSLRRMSQKQRRSHSRASAISQQAVWEVSSQW